MKMGSAVCAQLVEYSVMCTQMVQRSALHAQIAYNSAMCTHGRVCNYTCTYGSVLSYVCANCKALSYVCSKGRMFSMCKNGQSAQLYVHKWKSVQLCTQVALYSSNCMLSLCKLCTPSHIHPLYLFPCT